MATIHITDLEESVELDRDAMQEIIGGRGPQQWRTLGIGGATPLGTPRSAKGSFSGKQASPFLAKSRR